ncbi:MAG: hypothetical protein ACRDQD_00635 [Nocardioidaceae bacterium]
MTARILRALRLIGATVAALVLVAVLFLALVAPEETGVDPTDAPSGERAYPCAEDDRACNEWREAQESEE